MRFSFKKALTQEDKRKHLAAGFIISLLVGVFTNFLIGFSVSLLIGLLKEQWDGMGHGTKDKLDFVFTALGGLFAVPFAVVIGYFIN